MTPTLFLEAAIKPALGLLPPAMDTPQARAMILAIALQESKLQHRHQVRGPAVSYVQFELGLVSPSDRIVGGVAAVLSHDKVRVHVLTLCRALDIVPSARPVYNAMAYQDVLAAGMARLLLWTLPGALALQDDTDGAWRQYLAAWRPGKPHPHTWPAHYRAAWSVVLANA